MQFSTLVFSIMSLLTLDSPPDALQLELNNAVAAWQQDTGFISFLDYAAGLQPTFTLSLAFFANAQAAFAAEIDELSHKAVLDSNFIYIGLLNQAVINAYEILVTQGTFMQIVNGLTDMANTRNLVQLAKINDVRRAQVSLAIDAYLVAVIQALGNPVVFTTMRPAACG